MLNTNLIKRHIVKNEKFVCKLNLTRTLQNFTYLIATDLRAPFLDYRSYLGESRP